MTSRTAEAGKRAVDPDKAKEVAYVRGEKMADEKAYEKLQAAYGGGALHHRDEVRKRRWACEECQFLNVDTRDVCGKCLAPNTSVISQQRKARNDLIPARGGSMLDPSTQVMNVAGRCYRQFVQVAVGKIRRAPTASGVEQQQQQQQRRGGANDEDDEDDEPGCCDDAGAAPPSYGEGDAYSDGEDDAGGYYNTEGAAGAVNDAADEEEDEDGIRYDSLKKAFVMRMNVPERYYKFIIGKGGKTLQDIQRMTGATVLLKGSSGGGASPATAPPSSASEKTKKTKEEDGEKDIAELIAPNKTCIHAARIRLDGIILDNQDRVNYTHFLSVPLATSPDSRATFASFLHDMVRTCVDEEQRRIDPFMFQSPAKIHLTLLMLRLHNEAELEKARSLLVVVQEMMREMFSPNDMISFKGVNYMNDDPTEVHVIYLDLVRDAASRKLIDLIQKINSLFIDAELALPKDVAHNEKLHATVINSKWRSGAIADATAENCSHSQSQHAAARTSFDATEVLRLFGEWKQLGSHKLERVDLSVLGGGDSGGGASGTSDGYFPRVASAYFP